MIVAGYVDQARIGVDVIGFRIVQGIAGFQADRVAQVRAVVILRDFLGRAGVGPDADVVHLAGIEIGAVAPGCDEDVVRVVDGRLGEGVAHGRVGDPAVGRAVQIAGDGALGAGLVDDHGDVVPSGSETAEVEVLRRLVRGGGGIFRVEQDAQVAVGADVDGPAFVCGPDIALADQPLVGHRRRAVVIEPGLDGQTAGARVERCVMLREDEIIDAVELRCPHVRLRAQDHRRVVDGLHVDGNAPRIRAAVAVVDGDVESIHAVVVGIGRVGEGAVRVQGDCAVFRVFRQGEGQLALRIVQVVGDDLRRERCVLGDGNRGRHDRIGRVRAGAKGAAQVVGAQVRRRRAGNHFVERPVALESRLAARVGDLRLVIRGDLGRAVLGPDADLGERALPAAVGGGIADIRRDRCGRCQRPRQGRDVAAGRQCDFFAVDEQAHRICRAVDDGGHVVLHACYHLANNGFRVDDIAGTVLQVNRQLVVHRRKQDAVGGVVVGVQDGLVADQIVGRNEGLDREVAGPQVKRPA